MLYLKRVEMYVLEIHGKAVLYRVRCKQIRYNIVLVNAHKCRVFDMKYEAFPSVLSVNCA